MFSWVNEFVASPCYGHIALIDLLKDLIEYPELLNTKLQTHQKYPVIQRNPVSHTTHNYDNYAILDINPHCTDLYKSCNKQQGMISENY